MFRNSFVRLVLIAVLGATLLAPGRSSAQTDTTETAPPQEAGLPVYKPPPRGAPGGRVGGASRGTVKVSAANPEIELLAPRDHTGLSLDPAPILYYFVSAPVRWPTRFTISAPARPTPVLEANIPPPAIAGVHALAVADYPVRLQPGIVYTWSVSAIVDSTAPARDIVASASLLVAGPDPALAGAARSATATQRAVLFARSGYWYDAVAAAAAAEPFDRHAALDALMAEAGLAAPADYDRRSARFR
ncbi:MAG TPA: DUF928 domain-containing protein [Stellaceae bacterium]|nr:DUF928 domain-containing protein [Stellaceae bacterium]